MNPRYLAIMTLLATGLTSVPCYADGLFGLFGKKDEKAMPEQQELDRRDAEAREMVADAAAAAEKGNATKAAKIYLKCAKEYPLSSVAADAAIKSGELYESAGKARKAHEAYQEFIVRFKSDKRFQPVLDRQFALAMACKEGQFTGKVLGLPVGVSRAETIEMLETIASNAPRSRMAGKALLAVGELYQLTGNIQKTVASYQKVVDEMPGTPEADEAQFRIGQTYQSRAEQKDKDRTTVVTAREAYEDYLLQNPKGDRAAEAQGQINSLTGKEARETFEIARFYERTKKPQAAAIYYREVLAFDDADLSAQARERLDALGAAGVTAPAPIADDAWMMPEENLTKLRDDYVGPPVPDLRSALPTLRSLETEKLPGSGVDLPVNADNPLLDAPAPPAEDPAMELPDSLEPAAPTTPAAPKPAPSNPAAPKPAPANPAAPKPAPANPAAPKPAPANPAAPKPAPANPAAPKPAPANPAAPKPAPANPAAPKPAPANPAAPKPAPANPAAPKPAPGVKPAAPSNNEAKPAGE